MLTFLTVVTSHLLYSPEPNDAARVLANRTIWRNHSHTKPLSQNHSHFWHQLQVQGVSKIPWFLIILQKNSRNSLKAVILMVMFYYREKEEMKLSQQKNHIGQSLGKYQMQSFHFPLVWIQVSTSPALLWGDLHGALPTGKLTWPSMSRAFIRAPSHRHDWSITWLPIGLISLSRITQSPHLNQIGGLSGVASPFPKSYC